MYICSSYIVKWSIHFKSTITIDNWSVIQGYSHKLLHSVASTTAALLMLHWLRTSGLVVLLLLPASSALLLLLLSCCRCWRWSELVLLVSADAVAAVCAASEVVAGVSSVASAAWSSHSGSPLRLITWMSTSTPCSFRATACAMGLHVSYMLLYYFRILNNLLRFDINLPHLS